MPRYIVIQIPDDLGDVSAAEAAGRPDCPVVLDVPDLTELAERTAALDLANELAEAAVRRRLNTRLDAAQKSAQGPHVLRLLRDPGDDLDESSPDGPHVVG